MQLSPYVLRDPPNKSTIMNLSEDTMLRVDGRHKVNAFTLHKDVEEGEVRKDPNIHMGGEANDVMTKLTVIQALV